MALQNAKRDENYVTTLLGVASDDLITPERLAVDPATNRLLVTGTISSTTNPTLPTTGFTNQVTTNGTAVQFGTNTLSVGVIVQALSTNVASIYIGFSGVTTATGYELQPGQATSTAIDNTNKLYVIGTSGDKICWIGS